MPTTARALALLLAALPCALLAAGPARAEEGDPPAPAYPLRLRLELSPAARRATLVHLGGSGFNAPVNPAATVPVGDQARNAYLVLLDRRFRAAAEAPVEGVLEVVEVTPALEWDAAGWQARVTHRVVLRAADGEALGAWTVAGAERLAGRAPGALPLAFGQAARKAAARLDFELEDAPGVARWLAAHGVAPGSLRPAAPPAEVLPAPALAPQPGPPRAAWVLFIDAGGALAATDLLAIGIGGRAGLSTRRLFAQAELAWYAGGTRPDNFGGPLEAWRVGADVGLVFRPAPPIELRVGGGLARLEATVDTRGYLAQRQTVRKTVGSVLAVAQYTTPGDAAGGRIRLGAGLRQVFGGTLDFPTGYGPLPLEADALSLLVTVGYEFALR